MLFGKDWCENFWDENTFHVWGHIYKRYSPYKKSPIPTSGLRAYGQAPKPSIALLTTSLLKSEALKQKIKKFQKNT